MREKELALLFRLLCRGYTRREAARVLRKPMSTLYKWGQRYLSVYLHSNPEMNELVDRAGALIAKARSLPMDPTTLRRQAKAAKSKKPTPA